MGQADKKKDNSVTRSLRLCYVADATSIHVRRWLEYFVQRGHDVTCLSDKGGEIEGVRIVEVPNRDTLIARGEKANKTQVIKARARVVQHIAESLEPDVLHAIFLYHRGWSAALANVHPLVITLLGSDILLPPDNYRNKLHMLRDVALNQGALQQAELITAVNATLAGEARKLCRKDQRIELVPIGTNTRLFNRNIDRHALLKLRKTLNIPEDAFVILSPRQITPIYNIDVIIRAVNDIRQRIPNAVFILKDAFAHTPERTKYVNDLAALVTSELADPFVRWVGEVPYGELPLYYHLADAVVSIPAKDGLPVSVFDAMACGTPVISGDLPSYDDIIIHEQTGLRLPETTPKALTAAVIRLHEDKALRERIIENAGDVLSRYGIFEEQLARMEGLYHELAAQNHGPRSGKFNDMVYKTLLRVF